MTELIDTEAALRRAHGLKPMPASATRLAQLVSDPNAEVSQMVEAISLDPALTLKLLARANSASHGKGAGISTVQSAVVRLGTGAVLALAVAAGARATLRTPLPEYGIAEGALWDHSVATALAAECLPRVLRRALPPEVFTAALLHDVGKVLLAGDLDPETPSLVDPTDPNNSEGGHIAELEFCRSHHGELGGIVAQHWKLPNPVAQGIIHHHTPAQAAPGASSQDIAYAVQLSDAIAQHAGKGLGGVILSDEEFAGALEYFQLERNRFDEAVERAGERIAEVGSAYAG